MSTKARATLATVAAALADSTLLLAYRAIRWRNDPSACPYAQRLWVELPRPFLTRSRLRQILAPKPGNRVLEVGPGTGYYALHTARWLAPGGTLDVLDIQQEMLGHTMRRLRPGVGTSLVGWVTPATSARLPRTATCRSASLPF